MVTMDSKLLVLITKDQRRAIFAQAKKNGTTVSKLVRTACDHYLEKECKASK